MVQGFVFTLLSFARDIRTTFLHFFTFGCGCFSKRTSVMVKTEKGGIRTSNSLESVERSDIQVPFWQPFGIMITM